MLLYSGLEATELLVAGVPVPDFTSLFWLCTDLRSEPLIASVVLIPPCVAVLLESGDAVVLPAADFLAASAPVFVER